jgi:hypothetical protein
MRCKTRHKGPFSIGLHRTGQFRCENCDAVLSGVEVYLDTAEHAAEGKQAQAHFLLGDLATVDDGARHAVAERAIGEVKHQASAEALLRFYG